MPNLLEAAASGPLDSVKPETAIPETASPDSGGSETAAPSPARDPDAIPAKFIDAETGDVRVDALAKSYRALERKLSAVTSGREAVQPAEKRDLDGPDLDGDGVPDGPDGYDLGDLDGLASDADANAFLHEIGITRAQARALYGFAADSIVPKIRELQGQRDTARSAGARAELATHFGSDEAFATAAPGILTWAKATLPNDVADLLASTPKGIKALHKMMDNEDPALLVEGAAAASLSEAALEKVMDSPKFWRDQDPKTVELVRAGFKRLYPD